MKLIRRLFAKFGFELKRKTTEYHARECDGDFKHPIDAVYQTEWDRASLVWAKPELVVNSMGFNFGTEGSHPFVETLRQYKTGGVDTYRKTVLKEYYRQFQPKNLMELMLGYTDSTSKLSKYPPIDFGIPFSYCQSFEEALTTVKKWIQYENSIGNIESEDIIYDSQSFGPTKNKKGKAEFYRLLSIYKSIKQKGYQRTMGPDGDIRGYLLRKGDSFRYLVFGGHHRSAALSALNYNKIPIRLRTNFPIELRDFQHWPLVRSGAWPPELAKKYFNRFFEHKFKWRERGMEIA